MTAVKANPGRKLFFRAVYYLEEECLQQYHCPLRSSFSLAREDVFEAARSGCIYGFRIQHVRHDLGVHFMTYVKSFTAVAADGSACMVHVYQEFQHFSNSLGSQSVPTVIHMKTATGTHVNRIEKGIYDVIGSLGTTTRVTSDDPDAP